MALDRRKRDLACRAWLYRLIEDITQPLNGNPHLLKILPQLRHTDHWARYPLRKHVKRNKAANGQRLINHRTGAEIKDRSHIELGN